MHYYFRTETKECFPELENRLTENDICKAFYQLLSGEFRENDTNALKHIKFSINDVAEDRDLLKAYVEFFEGATFYMSYAETKNSFNKETPCVGENCETISDKVCVLRQLVLEAGKLFEEVDNVSIHALMPDGKIYDVLYMGPLFEGEYLGNITGIELQQLEDLKESGLYE